MGFGPPLSWNLPLGDGSGKEVSPCLRMHALNSAALFSSAVVGAWALSDPGGASDLHAWSAELNCGKVVMPCGRLNVPWAVGSGKFVTPWKRMHCANWTSLAEPVLEAVAPAAVAAVELAPGGELLHPAAAIAAAARAAASGPAVPRLLSPAGIFLPFITILMIPFVKSA